MISRRLFLAILCSLGCGLLTVPPIVPAMAADAGPGEFVARLGEKTIAKMTDVSLTPTARKSEFRGLLREGFALKSIGHFVLGKYRAETPQETIDEFVTVFEDYIVSLYGKQYDAKEGQRFLVEKVSDTSRPKDSMVMAKLVPGDGGDPLIISFQVRDLGDSFKILDVRFEGVSMVLAQREEFTSYIAKNGGRVEALIGALRKRIATAAANAGK
jgi:phospholipid transport system substrate-binding protein